MDKNLFEIASVLDPRTVKIQNTVLERRQNVEKKTIGYFSTAYLTNKDSLQQHINTKTKDSSIFSYVLEEICEESNSNMYSNSHHVQDYVEEFKIYLQQCPILCESVGDMDPELGEN